MSDDKIREHFGDTPKRLSEDVQTIADEGEDELRERLEDVEPADLRRFYLAACAALASYYQSHKLAVKREQEGAFKRTLGQDPPLH
jgi:hypothetical protein